MDVREVDFDDGKVYCRNGIAKRNAGMSIGGRIQNDGAEVTLSLLNPTDEFSFEIGLAELNFHSKITRPLADHGFDIRQRGSAINLRLPLAEEVEIGAV